MATAGSTTFCTATGGETTFGFNASIGAAGWAATAIELTGSETVGLVA